MRTFGIPTERFDLRPATSEHLDEIKSILSEPDVTKMLLGDISTPQALDKEARKWIDDDDFWAKNQYGSWGVFDRDGAVGSPGTLMGVVAASPSPTGEQGGTEIFYFVRPAGWGKGVAFEAASGMIGYLFGKVGVSAVEASIFAEINPASVKLAEKLGLKPAGRIALRDHGVDDEGLQEIVSFENWRVRNADEDRIADIVPEAAFRIGLTIAEGLRHHFRKNQ